MLDNIREFNVLGWATFPVNAKTKEPAVKNWKNRQPDIFNDETEREAYIKAGAYGIKLNPEDLIIDIDPRNFAAGDNPWKRLRTDLDLPSLKGPSVKTGGGGAHVYFKKPKDFRVLSSLPKYPGIDFRSGAVGKGAYVIGPGSSHPSGNKYDILNGSDFSKVILAPETLLSILQAKEVLSLDTDKNKTLDGGKQEYSRYCKWLEKFPPAIEGQNGDNQTFKAAVRGRDFGLSAEDTLKALIEVYNPLCSPLWSQEELFKKVKNAYQYAAGTPGKEDPIRVFSPQVETWDAETDSERKWDLDQHGNPKKTLRNAVNYFYLWPEFAGTVKFNKFTEDLEVAKPLPWADQRGPGKTWTDTDIILMKYYLIKKLRGIEFPSEMLWEAAYAAGMRHAYHPVREYVSGLTWDGVNRLDTWLTDYCGAANNAYTSAVGRKMILGMIARVFNPGVKFDYCMILEGAQGIGKSTVCAILGGEWYGDIILDPHGRDTVDAMRGKWVIELSEMEVTKRADVQALKAFISRKSDRARLAYARCALDFPRQCIFIGTINPDELGYLSDGTGNRRFWPVKCGDKIDMDGLAAARNQILAEAYTVFKKGEDLFLSGNLASLAEIEQKSRMSIDPWHDVISEWLLNEGKEVKELGLAQIYEHVLGGQMKQISKSDQVRIGRVLSDLGWHKWRPLRGGSRQYMYMKPVEDLTCKLE